ncbi:phenylalanine--tRNA ligase subunit alpha [Candidatus Uhrbacteria bacterium RIFCSPLOWO2_02_FULL_48_12]|uniref:phenylalanine--tRNA ligase n=1 Tax=Candidatus Uhrbacteria bacterium RIFCSPLOWO2_02_FULL_48_12 TaxID=1802407 RepID=A0A1F7VBF3_9BACT|nr:MAG: phenylalanine--tRNA ligase subunit alpha [Candidatus Uhrbacteria bacterium RIFCSPLOWO2_02_FULL_48_12]
MMTLEELKRLPLEAERAASAAKNQAELRQAEIRFLGRKSELTLFLRDLKNVPKEKRSLVGRAANETRVRLVEIFEEHTHRLTESLAPIDVTLLGIQPRLGHSHLVSQAIEEISAIFKEIGFKRVRHPEVESDWYAFESLNMPPDHPARDEWETFFMDHSGNVGDRFVLTPHATSGTARVLATRQLPLCVINIQKCYRRQSDVSHVPMFHQFDGLYADQGVTIRHLKGVLEYFVKSYFGAKREVRLRPHHFPFTEPSFEVDISCGICSGRGCRLCKEGWVELGGAGMLHPNVLKAAKIDSKKITALAFGWGVERTLLMRSGLEVPDIRILYENDLRFLEQF